MDIRTTKPTIPVKNWVLNPFVTYKFYRLMKKIHG